MAWGVLSANAASACVHSAPTYFPLLNQAWRPPTGCGVEETNRLSGPSHQSQSRAHKRLNQPERIPFITRKSISSDNCNHLYPHNLLWTLTWLYSSNVFINNFIPGNTDSERQKLPITSLFVPETSWKLHQLLNWKYQMPKTLWTPCLKILAVGDWYGATFLYYMKLWKNDINGAILKWISSSHSRGTALHVLFLETLEYFNWEK